MYPKQFDAFNEVWHYNLKRFVVSLVNKRRYAKYYLGVVLICFIVGVSQLSKDDVEDFSLRAQKTIAGGYWTDLDDVKNSLNVRMKIAYVSRHSGTKADFKYMAKQLQLENVDYYETGGVFADSSKASYRKLLDNGVVDEICSKYDAIFVSDCLSDGWGFIMEGKQKCKNVVFVTTNRFDICIYNGPDRLDFHEDFNYAINREDIYKARVIANNRFEETYMLNKGINLKEHISIIRPFGYSSIPVTPILAEDYKPSCLITSRVTQDSELLSSLVLANTNQNCKILGDRYGGPKTLAQYNSILLHIPYQVSTMKMWENMNYGIITAIPSPDFFTKICKGNRCKETIDIFRTKELLGEQEWYTNVDFYLPELSQCYIQFSSWDELKTIITSKSYIDNINSCRNTMDDIKQDSIQQWRSLLVQLNG